MVETSASVPLTIVYPAVADRIGLLKSEAMDIVEAMDVVIVISLLKSSAIELVS
jgi:hypothetical protein